MKNTWKELILVCDDYWLITLVFGFVLRLIGSLSGFEPFSIVGVGLLMFSALAIALLAINYIINK